MNEIKGVEVKKLPKHHSRRKRLTVFAVVSLVALVVAGGLYVYFSHQSDRQVSVCTNTQLQESSNAINSNETSQLVGTVRDIQQKPGYDSDVNCLYIVTQYHIGITDPANARKYFDMLQKQYNPEVGYAPALGDKVATPDKLLQAVILVEAISKDAPSASLANQEQGQ